MSLLMWYLVALGLIILWILIEYVIWKSKYYAKMEKFNLSFYGPFLMWRTQRGRDIIERASKNSKFCKFYGNISLAIVGFAMVTMTVTLMWVATLVIRIPEARQIEPHMLLGLPGLNPIIPLWYGIFGLVIAIIIHEFSHGIMARHADVKVLSLGLTFWIIPMGAFMEPDEEKIMKIDAASRTRMFAVGPSSNLIIAGICCLIFSGLLMGAVVPVHEGVGITFVDETFNFDDIEFATPASNISLEEGMVITSFNGSDITDRVDFTVELNKTTANQTVDIEYMANGQLIQKNVTLAYKGYYLRSEWGDKYDENLEK
ncbi:MAG: site-2 protease family protein, partial [Thermoplasmata archaeon]|nr:site-2 protease family protein [Thermoplasmata archaeon]